LKPLRIKRNHAGIAERQSVKVSSKQVRPKTKRFLPASFAPHRLNRKLRCLSWSSSPENSASASSLPQPPDLPAPQPAVVVGEEDLPNYTASTLNFDANRAEFEELARSAGATIAAILVQRRQKPDPSSLVGRGKLDEIVSAVASTNASLVLFGHDLTPHSSAISRPGFPAMSSTVRSSYWMSSPAMPKPVKASSR
jgi:hypothetical protein